MKARFFLLPAAILALACGGGTNPGGSDDSADIGLPFPDSVPTDDTWSGGDDSNTGPGRLCPDYSGLGEQGSRWEWAYTPEYADSVGQDSSWTITTTQVDGGRVVTRNEGEIEHPSYQRYDYVMTSEYRCDGEGAWFLGYEQRLDYRIEGVDYWHETTASYDEPYLVMPRGAGAGDSWTVDYSGVIETDNSQTGPQSQDFSGTATLALAEGGTVNVPAGSFDTLVLSYDGQASSWLDADAGSVETTNAHLLDFEP